MVRDFGAQRIGSRVTVVYILVSGVGRHTETGGYLRGQGFGTPGLQRRSTKRNKCSAADAKGRRPHKTLAESNQFYWKCFAHACAMPLALLEANTNSCASNTTWSRAGEKPNLGRRRRARRNKKRGRRPMYAQSTTTHGDGCTQKKHATNRETAEETTHIPYYVAPFVLRRTTQPKACCTAAAEKRFI